MFTHSFLCFSVRSLPLVLTLSIMEKSLILSSLPLPHEVFLHTEKTCPKYFLVWGELFQLSHPLPVSDTPVFSSSSWPFAGHWGTQNRIQNSRFWSSVRTVRIEEREKDHLLWPICSMANKTELLQGTSKGRLNLLHLQRRLWEKQCDCLCQWFNLVTPKYLTGFLQYRPFLPCIFFSDYSKDLAPKIQPPKQILKIPLHIFQDCLSELLTTCYEA